MNRDASVGIFVVLLLLGGIVLFARRPYSPVQSQYENSASIALSRISNEAPHYRNKETRYIEYNDLNLPVKIEIVRDYTIS
jgi:hypothetical protein